MSPARLWLPGLLLVPLFAATATYPGTPPPEHVLFVGDTYVAWNPTTAISYDVVRGDLRELWESGGDFSAALRECVTNDLPRPFIEHTTEPGPGEFFFYLARVTQPLSLETYDAPGAGQVAGRDESVNASPVACPGSLPLHAAVLIAGNSDFTEANGVTGGSGTPEDPYIVERFRVFAPRPEVIPIHIRDTDAHFVMRYVRGHSSAVSGILLERVQNGRIEFVEASWNSGNGIEIRSSREIIVADSPVLNYNTGAGLRVVGSSGITLERNDLANNLLGMSLDGADASLVRRNNFLGNALQSIQTGSGTTLWDDGYPAGGNYWDNDRNDDVCSGPDQNVCPDPDGIGDRPYLFNEAGADRYPLMIMPGAVFDDVPPGVLIDAPVDGSVVSAPSLVVTGRAGDGETGLRRIEMRVNDGPWAGVSANLSLDQILWEAPVTLAAGENLIEVRSIDHANNISEVASARVTYDDTPPPPPVVVETDRDNYLQGDPVEIAITLTNTTSEPLTLTFPDSCQVFFSVEDFTGSVVYDYRAHVGCFTIVTELTLQPGESEVYNFTWNQVDDFGAPVPFGDYVVRSFVDSTPSMQEGSTVIGIVENTVVATVETEKQLYTVGESVALAITVMNIGTDPVTLTFGGCHTFYTVETAATGETVYDDRLHAICTAVITQVTLNPGESRVYTDTWNQLNDVGVPVPQGEYVIRSVVASDPPVAEGSAAIVVQNP